MQANSASFRQREAGSGLLAVLFFMILASVTVAMIFSVTSSNVTASRRTVDRAIAVTYADGVLENLFDQWRMAITNVSNTTDRTYGLSNATLASTLTAPNSTTLPPPPGVSLSSWSVTACTPLLAPTTDPAGRPTLEIGSSSRLRVRVYYRASVNVRFPGLAGNNIANVQRIFVRGGRNIFDNFFFGTQNKVEFHPGPPMYVNGTVYVGGNLYTAHDSLHFLKDVTFTGTQTLNFRTEDARYGVETPNIATNGLADNWDINNPPHLGDQQKLLDTPLSSLDPNFIDDPSTNDTDSDGNPNNNGYHEIIEEVTDPSKPDPLQLDSTTSERLSKNADYRIYVNAANTLTIYAGSSTTPLSGAALTALTGAISLNTALSDTREGDNVRMVTVDVSKISTAAQTGTITDSVGGGDGYLLYIVDTSVGSSVATKVVNSATGAQTAVTSSHARGVKLIKGATLPSTGLSVVSPNPIYIQGDYNTGVLGSKPASDTASSYTPPTDTPSPTVGAYTRAAAAVVGDSVNILSNSWNDANSLSGLGSRIASSTTVNTAIVAGNVPTTTSSYSGGIENFTRFNEDWSSSYFTIYGALALLYDSEQATHPWVNASYSPPNRRWYYDNLLLNNNPPGFRAAHVYSRGKRIQN